MALGDNTTAALLADAARSASGAGTPTAADRLAQANALLEAAHRLIVRGLVRPIRGHEAEVFGEALEWRNSYAEFKRGS